MALVADGTTLEASEFDALDGITAGTAVASKALIIDANKDIGTIRNLTIDGTFTDGNYTFDSSGNVSGLGTVGCGAVTATAAITVTDTTAPLILKYDAEEYVTHAVSSAGVYSITTTDASSDSGAITLDTIDTITLDSATATEGIVYAAGGTDLLRIFNSSSDVILKPLVDAKDLIIQQRDGTEVARFEDGGSVKVADNLLLASDDAVLALGASNDFTITHDGATGATIAGNPITIDSGAALVLDAHTGIWNFKDAGTSVLTITEGNSGDVTVKLVIDTKDLIFTDNNDAEGFRIHDAAVGVSVVGDVRIKEAADHAQTPGAGHGHLWVKNTAPCELYFTTDAGDDVQLTDGASAAGGGGGGASTAYDKYDADQLLDSDDDFVAIDANTNGAFNLTLPDAGGASMAGKRYIIKEIMGESTNAVTLISDGSDKIEGSTSNYVLSLIPYFSVTLVCDGVDSWWLV